jgi:hypothetical protein
VRRALVVMLGVGVAALAGCTGSGPAGGSPPETQGSAPAEETVDLPPFTEPGDTGAVELVQADLTWLVNTEGREPVGFGFIVENTSALVATDTGIRVDLVEESGVVVWTSSLTAWLLVPGQRFGAGTFLMPEQAQPAEIRVTVGGSLWYPLDSPGTEFGRMTVTEAGLDYPEDCVWGGASLEVESTYARELHAEVTGVLRNGDGDIIGGTGLESPPDRMQVRPGSSRHEQELRGVWGCGIPVGGDHREITAEFYLTPRSAVETGQED